MKQMKILYGTIFLFSRQMKKHKIVGRGRKEGICQDDLKSIDLILF